jgi:hypothetical protein
MKLAIPLIVLSIMVIAVAAQSSLTAASPTVTAYVILGKGIAANPDDTMDFMIAKFGIGKVRYGSVNSTIGVLKLDEELYRLRTVVIEEGHAIGSIYRNSSEVGSFDVYSVMKGDTEVWAGTMTLYEKIYNLYVIEGVRPVKASELRERVVEYCTNNEDANCRDRLQNYCENNPDDARCRALFRAWCLRDNNMDDTRCRYEFREWCKENPRNAYCIPFALNRSIKYCEEHSDSVLCEKLATDVANICESETDNEGCAKVQQLVTSAQKLLQNAQAIKTRIMNIAVNASLRVRAATSAELGGV